MVFAPIALKKNYWESFELEESDVEFIYNRLLELEIPQSPDELLIALIHERIQKEIVSMEKKQNSEGMVYLPKETYSKGQTLIFPALDWKKGIVLSSRLGINPDICDFQVIEVDFGNDGRKLFAANLNNHVLNNPTELKIEDKSLNPEFVLDQYGELLKSRLISALETNSDLVQIAGKWFPRALLVDVNMGYLNLAEAVLDMAGGGPLTTQSILEQIELPTDVNLKLTEFSLNLALQEDGRFDEVGPAGEVMWFLKKLEPEAVQKPPIYLNYTKIPYEAEKAHELAKQVESLVPDELEEEYSYTEPLNSLAFPLIYPHWRAGTLPLSSKVRKLFPTAYESPRVQFTFIDGDSGEKFNGWVVRPYAYVYGLRDWYQSKGIYPGAMIEIKKGDKPGEVIVNVEKRKSSREWIRTVLVGSDGGIVFAMLKQMVTSAFDERMIVAIPDPEAIDQVWDQTIKKRTPLQQIVQTMMRELSKLNPQGHVHAQEVYSAVNIIRRCPPGPILNILLESSWSDYLGDLYFRLGSVEEED